MAEPGPQSQKTLQATADMKSQSFLPPVLIPKSWGTLLGPPSLLNAVWLLCLIHSAITPVFTLPSFPYLYILVVGITCRSRALTPPVYQVRFSDLFLS